jgi:malonyl CoA-acyl carrier protein transacylase/NAD(P)-dependent dehydrogenase (short-subunit alcohol dehydrogenase family)/acyl carrier protein
LILLSARTPTALDKMTKNLAEYFKKNLLNRGNHENPTNPGPTLANAAYTLKLGRAAFKYRRMLVCSNIHEAMDILSSPDSSHLHSFAAKEEKQPMVFMFPGQGSQYVDMGWGLYIREPAFKEDMDRCFEILKSLMGYDIKEILYPRISMSEASREERTKKINQTKIAQPVLFVFEYALAKQLMRWGIKPDAMIGHSIGEYTAACLAGVFSLEDALSLVAMRGKLMQKLPPGRMVSIPLPQEKVKALLTEELSLAAVNSSSLCTVSGPSAAVDSFEKMLNTKGYESRILHTSHAFHSKMMDAILDEFEKGVERINRHPPHIPFISNLSGQWLTGEQAQSPRYWAHHLRSTVLFSQGISKLLKDHHIFLEVGPGKTLSTCVKKNVARKPGHLVEDLVRHPQENVHDYNFLLLRLGKLWLYGKDIDWSGFYQGKKRQRAPLPAYPFEKKRYWPDRHAFTGENKKNLVDTILQGKKPDIADWFYIPNWERSSFPLFSLQEDIDTKSTCWMFFMDERGIGERLVKKFGKNNNVIIVKVGPVFSRLSDREYTINPCKARSYDILLKELKRLELIPHRIVHLWGITGDMGGTLDIPRIPRALDLGFYSLFHLSRGLGKHNLSHELRIMVLTDNMQEVTGKEALCPEKAPLLGAVKVIPLEYPHINCRCIDIVLPPGESARQETEKLIDHLLAEITGDAHDKVIAFRGLHRWHPVIKPVRFELTAEVGNSRRTKPGGVYLVTGGLGGMGLSIAQYLAGSVRAKLVLVGRSTFPAREKWEKLSQKDNSTAENIRKIQKMEKKGAEVMVLSADAADEGQMRIVIDQVIKRFGKLNGIIHTAGVADYGGVIQRRTREETEKILLPKVYGTVVLDRIVKDMKLDFFVLCSTIGNIAYHQKLGQVGYSAANEFLDAFAYYRNLRDAAAGKTDTLTVSINWPDLKDVGMAVKSSEQWAKTFNTDSQTLLEDGLLVSEAIEVFRRVLDKGFPQVVVSPVNLVTKIEEGASLLRELLEKGSASSSILQRPELTTHYVAPGNELEQKIALQFRQLFGIEKVGIHDNFFDFGATSLDIIRLNSKLKEVLKRDIPLVSMYNYSTIHSLSKYLNQEETNKMERESEKLDALDESRRVMKNTLRKIRRP